MNTSASQCVRSLNQSYDGDAGPSTTPRDPPGTEPQAQRRIQHRDADRLAKQLGPIGARRQLAELRDRHSDPARAALIEDAMIRRRNAVNAAASGDGRRAAMI